MAPSRATANLKWGMSRARGLAGLAWGLLGEGLGLGSVDETYKQTWKHGVGQEQRNAKCLENRKLYNRLHQEIKGNRPH